MSPLAGMWKHRKIAWQFARRYVEMGFRGSVLGVAWVVLGPLLMLGLYSFVFGLFGGYFDIDDGQGGTLRAEGLDYALGIFLGLTVLNLFSGVLSAGPSIVVGNPNFVKKVVFPLDALPVALVGQFGFNFCVGFILCMLGLAFLGTGSGVVMAWLWAPAVLVPLFLMALGLSWFLSAIGVFLRDTGQMAPFLGMALLYSSAVFYPVSLVVKEYPRIWTFLKWNPVLHGVDQLRQIFLWGIEPDLNPLIYLWAVGFSALFIGHWVFLRLRDDFADLL